MEGFVVSHRQAIRLIQLALERDEYGLVGDLLRFIMPPSERAGRCSNDEGGGRRIIIAQPEMRDCFILILVLQHIFLPLFIGMCCRRARVAVPGAPLGRRLFKGTDKGRSAAAASACLWRHLCPSKQLVARMAVRGRQFCDSSPFRGSFSAGQRRRFRRR